MAATRRTRAIEEGRDMAFSFSDCDSTLSADAHKEISIFVIRLHMVYLCGRSFLISPGGGFSMYRNGWIRVAAAWLIVATGITLCAADKDLPPGFTSLFNGKDLSGWKVPEGDNGHWKVSGGVIDYDARSEGRGDKCLRTEKSFGDFVLRVDWR